jgi:hypothetical protein
MKRSLACAGVIALSITSAHAGGILMCDQFHCRSVVEFPPPIVLTVPFPPVLSTQRPVYQAPPPPVRYAQPRASRPDVQVPPPDSHKEIEGDIMTFCDGHPDEPFCGKLGQWLRDHGRQQ